MKIQNEDLIAKIYQYEDALMEMEQMQKKFEKYELQEIKKQYGDNEKKENEISILKAENRILKTTISNYEDQIHEFQNNFDLYKLESQEIIEKHKLIIENLKFDLKNYEIMDNNQAERKENNNSPNVNGKFFNNSSNRSITKSNTKIFSENNSKSNNIKYGNNNNGIYKINYNSINYNLTNQKSNSNNINGINDNEKDKEKENNKLIQSTNTNNQANKQEIYRKIFEKLKTVKAEKSETKPYFKVLTFFFITLKI